MSNLKRDINYVEDLMKNRKNIFKLYPRTNENLNTLFRKIDVLNKKIYTVLASGDFLFSSYLNGVNHIDSFDINPLTYRYYELRKWLLQYGELYADGMSVDDVRYIVNNHEGNDEESIKFWNYYIDLIQSSIFYDSVLFDNSDKNHRLHCYDRIDELNSIVTNRTLSFYNINIFDYVQIPNANFYDIIYLSNILDYNMDDRDKLYILSDTLRHLLKGNGIVIGAQMPEFSHYTEKIKDIFSQNFYFEKLFYEKDGKNNNLYYSLLRK